MLLLLFIVELLALSPMFENCVWKLLVALLLEDELDGGTAFVLELVPVASDELAFELLELAVDPELFDAFRLPLAEPDVEVSE